MAIRNFKFPGVELNQEFVQTPVTGVSTLGVVIVGQQYKLITADLDDEKKTVLWDYDGTDATVPLTKVEVVEGTTITTNLPGYIKADTEKGEKQTQNLDTSYEPVKVAVKDAEFSNFTVTSSSTYVKIYGGTVAINGTTATATNTLDLTEGVESAVVPLDGSVTSEIASNAFGSRVPLVGDAVLVSGTSGTAKGFITALKQGTYTVTTVEDETETTEQIASTVVYVKIVEGAEELGGSTVSSLNFLVAEDTVFDATVVSGEGAGLNITDPSKKIGGKDEASLLIAGEYTVSPTCRYTDTAFVNHLGSVDSIDEIESIFGTASVANPMALALLFALYAGRENIVYFTGVSSEDPTAYAKAMDFLDRYDDVYSVVPMASSETDNGVEILATVLDSIVTASENTESKVRRTLWYGIETPTDSSFTASSLIVDAIIDIRGKIATSYRAQAVWADGARFNGEIVPNYILAAAPAGMRSYEPTYRPISNLAYEFFSVEDSNGFTNSDLIRLGSNGVWIIDNNYEGTPINKKQVTTAVANNLNLDEESIVANADSIALTLCHVGEDLVGCSNISPALLKSLSDTITAIMDNYLINRTGNAYIGPQLLSWTLDSLYQHEVLLDHIYAVITCEPPKPFNRFVMTLRIV